MAEVRVLVITGLGLNCEAETEAAFRLVGAQPERVHLLDMLEGGTPLSRYGILALIGGFAFGDHLGAGCVFANKIRNRLQDQLEAFIDRGGLVIGICNGFQTMVRLGLLPGLDGERRASVSLAPNDRLGYRDAWVRLSFEADSPCVWTRGLKPLDLPARHGEGKLVTDDDALLERLEREHLVAARYVDHDGQPTERWPHNPNGSPHGIAALSDPTGRLFGIMPHPDAYLYPFHHPRWLVRRARGEALPDVGGGLAIFQNGVDAAAAAR